MIIVTGAGRGIGEAVALRASEIDDVCVHFHRSAERAGEVVEHIKRAGGVAIAVQADLSQEEQVVELFRAASDALGPVRGLVNNAGSIGGRSTVVTISAHQLDQAYGVMLRGLVLCIREAARTMAKSRGGNGGAIVNMSSLAAHSGAPNRWVHYAALKAAVNAYTVGSAKELGPEGIRVNAIAPRYIATNIHADNGFPNMLAEGVSKVALGRIGTCDEVAQAALFLLSERSSYISGAILDVTGG